MLTARYVMRIQGAPECRCVNPWAIAAPATIACDSCGSSEGCQLLTVQRELHHTWDGEGIDASLGQVCVPLDYGASLCEAWDSDSARCSGEPRPDWCSSRWCYVNASACERPNDVTEVLEATQAGLAYSYETCGNLNSYSQERHFSALRGRTIRVSYPGDSGSGYTLYTANGERQGSMVDFVKELAMEHSFHLQPVDVTQDSVDEVRPPFISGSSFSGDLLLVSF